MACLRISSTLGRPLYAGSFVSCHREWSTRELLWGKRGCRRLFGIAAVLVLLLDTASTRISCAGHHALFAARLFQSSRKA